MADEPRRSGRATKGQHTKDREDTDDPSKPMAKGKGKRAKAEAEAEPEPEEEEDEIIRCVCGQYEEETDEPRAMICCDSCSAWQHNDCMGLPEDYSPDKYYCEQCKPNKHKELLAAMKRGERPWEATARRREEERADKAAKKKGKKGGRKSGTTARISDVQDRTPTVEPEQKGSSRKRKHEESPARDVRQSKKARPSTGPPIASPEAQDETIGEAVDEMVDEANGEAEVEPDADVNIDVDAEAETEALPEAQPDAQPESTQESVQQNPILTNVAKDAKEIHDPSRSKIASNVVKIFIEQVNALVHSGTTSLAKGDTAKSLGTRLALQVEHAVYYLRSGGEGEPNDAYRDQMRAILNNIKTNRDLTARLVSKDLPADEFAAMEPKDMATNEQKQKDAEEKMRMDKQHVLVDEQGPRIRRTHKGDEYVDESRQVAESTTSNSAPVKKQSTIDQDTEMKSPTAATPGEKPPTMRKSSAAVKSKLFNDPRRKSSSNFDISKVWSGVQGSPTEGEAPKLPQVPRQGSPTPMTDRPPVADPDVDRLLKDEDNESEPYSPKDFVEEGVVWRGRLNGGSLGSFNTIAKFAAGCQPDVDNLRMTWSEVIPPEIKLHGRIQPSKADDYLCGLEYSNSTELIIVSLTEPKDVEDKAQFDRFFNYLKQKDRYGVGSQHSCAAIKDIYLLPMEVGQPLPTVMRALDHAFTDPVSERSFLVPIVIKWTELPHNAERVRQQQLLQQQAAQSPSVGPPVAQTPITPHEPQMMHFDQHPQAHAQSEQHQPPNGSGHPPQHATPSPAPAQAQYSTPPPQSNHNQAGFAAHAPVQAPISQGVPNDQNRSIAAVTALRVLGREKAALPSVIELVKQAPNAGENEFTIIKECLEENPQAGQSLAVLTLSLQQKHQEKRSSKERDAGAHAQAT